MITAVVIDKNPACRRKVATILESEFDDLYIAGSSDNFRFVNDIIQRSSIDLLFISSDLQDGDCFGNLRKIQ